MWKAALIGAGIIAKEHIEALEKRTDLRVVAIADIVKEKLTNYPFRKYLNYKEMILNESPDIVIISLPHFLHKEAALFCASQGCHILLEKPMALNTAECREIITAAEHYNIQLLVGHIQHYFTENMVAKEIIRKEELGKVLMVKEERHMNYFVSERPDWFLDRSKSGGGVMMNIGVHSIDKLQWMLSTRFSKVLANLTFESGTHSDIEGSGIVYLQTAEGIPATILISGYQGVPRNSTEFICAKGMLKVETGKGVWKSVDGDYERVISPEAFSPFSSQLTELTDAIEGKAELENSSWYGQSVIKVVEAIYQSHNCGEVIELS
ncbi:Gfo/Idh/MocA family oxidoreductase [Halobacillus rhizosphaerae]|uniref:Gfo/Idh/MocA family protein n=1 Tax=Halobacillus rhizosphaerae TaxID=3064889 RepID=UPI00398A76BC